MSRRPASALRRRPRVEPLEARQLLASLMVSSPADDSPGSLRAAIEAADLDTTTPVVEIDFGIAGGAPATINLATALPTITRPVFLDASTQSDEASSPGILIDGNNTPAGSDGLTIAGAGSTVAGVEIRGFTATADSTPAGGRGIVLMGAGGDLVIRDEVGGFDGQKGNSIGVEVDAPNTTIGGGGGLGNVISGNGGPEYANLSGALDGAGLVVDAVAGAVIQGNRIGTDVTGLKADANGTDGVMLEDAIAPVIGGPGEGEGNVISNNATDGIFIDSEGAPGQVSDATIQGNIIGLDAGGHIGPEEYEYPYGEEAVSFGNHQNGIEAYGGSGITIGGTAAGAGNVVSSNRFEGIVVHPIDADGVTLDSGSGTLIQGNRIGTEGDGIGDAGNGEGGIAAAGGGTIGGTASGAGNVVSWNSRGLDGGGIGARNFTIQGNMVGTDPSGRLAEGNGGYGVSFGGSNTLGGTTPGSSNVISDNFGGGVKFSADDAYQEVIQGNFIGTDITGTKALGNHGAGISISDGNSTGQPPALPQTGAGVTIGGTVAGAGNVISGNTLAGIALAGETDGPDGSYSPAAGVLVQGNSIGVDASGAIPLPNLGDGIDLNSSLTPATVGGVNPGEGNTIAENKGGGVVEKAGGSLILGNSIHDNSPAFFPIISPSFSRDPAPILTAAIRHDGGETVFGTFAAAPGEARTFEFFAGSSATDAARFYLGTGQATADSTGRGYLRITLATPPSFLDRFAATAVYPASAEEPFGATSGFSNGVTSTAETDPFTDLVVAGSGPTAAENPSSIGTYTFTVTNDGYRPALGVTLNELFPDVGPLQSATTSQGLIAFTSDGDFVGKLGTLAPGASATVTFRAGFSGVSGGRYQAETLVTSLTPDVVPQDNSLTLSTPISATAPALPVADLSLAATSTSRTVSAWTEVTYELTATNGGTGDAQDAALFYTLPDAAILVSATSNQGNVVIDRGNAGGGIVTAYFGAIPDKAEGKLSIVVRVASTPKGRTLISQGVIRAANSPGDEAHAHVNQAVKVS